MEMMVSLGKEMGKVIREAIAPLKAKIESLERQGQARGIRWTGGWARDVDFHRGDMCTHRGALWIATSDGTKSMPGADNDWQRMLKANRNGTIEEDTGND
jgi:hypothetical protein